MTPHLKKIQIARAALLLDHPFFGVLALQLKLIEDATAPTMYTDGRVLGYNPAFVDKLTPEQLIGVVAHEVMHCACGHPWRRDSRDMMPWNIACDLAINPIIKEAGLQLPPGALFEKEFVGKSAEWIYARLPPQPPNTGNGCGEVRDGATSGDPADGPGEVEWQQITQQSAQQAKLRGKLPASLARTIADATAPTVDWRSVLRRFVQETVNADYSWQMPNRRYIASGMYLPALYSKACGRIGVAVDTSGSVDDVLLQQFAGEINAIASEVEPSAIEVIYCDAKVQRVDEFTRHEVITMHAKGGGGTDFRPVFDYFDDHDAPAVLIYLTDLYGTFPDDAPSFPVLWCVCSREDSVPFGEVVSCAQ